MRILWDRKLNRFFVCDAYDYVHNDMARMALSRGYYGDMRSWELDEYLDDDGKNVIYYIYAPKGKEKETYGSDVTEDGYEGKFVYDFGVVTTRSDDRYKASPLAKALGKYKEHYVHNGWIDNYIPRVQLVDNVNESVVNAPRSKIYSNEEKKELLQKMEEHFGFSSTPSAKALYILPNGNFMNVKNREHRSVEKWLRGQKYSIVNYEFEEDDKYLTPEVELGCIRINLSDKYYSFIVLNEHIPTSYQYQSILLLLDFIYSKGYKKISVVRDGFFSADDTSKIDSIYREYSLNEYISDDILKKIKKYYATGRLEEKIDTQKFDRVADNEFKEINKFLYKFGF